LFVFEEGNFKIGETGDEPLGQGREQKKLTYTKIWTKTIWVQDLDQPRPHLDGWGLGLGALTIEPQLYLQVRKLIGNISYR